jgi:glutaredoxin
MNRPLEETNWRASVVIYGRHGCHLCDEALEMLGQLGVTPTVVDIDTDPQLQERFGTCIPVVEINGRIRFRGRVHPVLLRRQLAAIDEG